MQIKTDARLLTAESKPYSFGGNEGVSHRVRLLVDGEIFACKSTSEDVAALARFEDQEGEAVLKLTSRKEMLGVEIESFEPKA